MDYVYTISYRGVVFYVGSSGQPLNRFYYHVSGNNLYTRFRVYEILKKGNFPKLTIVYHSPDKKEVLKKVKIGVTCVGADCHVYLPDQSLEVTDQ